jgi:hypothetical protein
MEPKFFGYKCAQVTPEHGVFVAYYSVDQDRPGAILIRGNFIVGDELEMAFPTTQTFSELMKNG